MSLKRFAKSISLTAIILATAFLLCSLMPALTVLACPFCSAVSVTLAEQMSSKDVVVACELVENLPAPEDSDELARARFKIIDVLVGEQFVKSGMTFEAIRIGRYQDGQTFFVMGVNPPDVRWSTPMKANAEVLEYMKALPDLPERGADRLAFFQQYFEHENRTLAMDAYDEFAVAPYEELIELKDRMDRSQLIEFIKDPDTEINRRRLYLTMLGVCGTEDDADMLEQIIESDSRKERRGLDALIACYLNLKGDDGIELIERLFLANPETEYTDVMKAVSALRFHGAETDKLSTEKIAAAVRNVLDRREMADMVVPDLARWEDWSVMERLVTMFRDSDKSDNFIRVPVITYLQECPLPEAKKHLAALKEIDPVAYKQASFFSIDFGDADDSEEMTDDSEEMTADSEEMTAKTKVVDEPSQSQDASQTDAMSRGSTEATVPADAETPDQSRLPAVPVDQTYVVRKVDLDDDEIAVTAGNDIEYGSTASMDSTRNARVVSSTPPVLASAAESSQVNAPLASGATGGPVNLTWQIILFPMAASLVLLMLLWSVVSGWFERLIF